jgi:hypothetical protein
MAGGVEQYPPSFGRGLLIGTAAAEAERPRFGGIDLWVVTRQVVPSDQPNFDHPLQGNSGSSLDRIGRGVVWRGSDRGTWHC